MFDNVAHLDVRVGDHRRRDRVRIMVVLAELAASQVVVIGVTSRRFGWWTVWSSTEECIDNDLRLIIDKSQALVDC